MAFFKVPRQLMEFFNNDQEIQTWLQQLENILTGSSSSLDDLDQRSSIPALSRIDQVEKELDYLKKDINNKSLKAQIYELRRQINDIEERLGTR